ncbi:DUF6446 family protein [Paracoccus sp. p4-l81]|uniref:DUF6446 family protein n=1 Tax=unclassified Paracoccus (in: a-proteobacteria) TaxID=2688777 RepID=UPI0035BB1934
MNGRIVGAGLILVAALSGLVMYYLQVYGFYEPVDQVTGVQELAFTDANGAPHPLPVAGFAGIDAASSPLRYRACFTLTPSALTEGAGYDAPTPLNGPKWFQCYNARALTEDLASGAARAYLGTRNIHPGIDRVIAVYPDGRAFAWHQLNESAEEKKVIE